MGRAGRKNLSAGMMVRRESPFGKGVRNPVPMRIPGPTPATGGPQQSTFLDRYVPEELVEIPSWRPQGPPLLEDGEENPEAAALDDISLGQIGTDTLGNSFQLLRASGEVPPKRLLLRCMNNDEVFWIDNKQQTVCRDTLSYGNLQHEHLSEWVRSEGLGRSEEEAVLALYRSGVWDFQVRDRDRTFTLLGNWTINETADRKVCSADLYADAVRARQIIENLAENVEIFPAIEAFYTKLENKTLPAPKDDLDRVRQVAWKALLGKTGRERAAREVMDLASSFPRDQQDRLGDIAMDLLEFSPVPKITDDDFVRRVAPLWRRVASFHLSK